MLKSFVTRALSLSALLTLGSSPAMAATWYVDNVGGGTGTSPASRMLPQYAINSAASGDVLLFAAGTYNVGASYGLNIGVNGKALRLVGTGIGSAILDLTTTGVGSTGGADLEMIGFTFQNGAGGANISANGATLRLRDSEVVGFTTTVAILASIGSFAELTNVDVLGNVYGLMVTNASNAFVDNCVFDTQSANGVSLAGVSATIIQNSVFINNFEGVAIQTNYANTYSNVHHNQFTGNDYGITVLDGGAGYDAFDQIHHNSIDTSVVSAIYSSDPASQVDIRANYIHNNAQGIYLAGNNDVVHNNVVDGSFGGTLPGNAIESHAGNATIAHNTVVGNASHGIVAVGGDTSLIVNNASIGNTNYGIVAFGSAGARVGFNNAQGNATNYVGPYIILGGNIVAVPGFIGPGNYDLVAASPMINAASWALFAEPFDHAGVPRPAGNSDIGAFEF